MFYRDMTQDYDRLRREFDQILRDSFGPVSGPRWRTAFLPGVSARTYPLINLRDEGDAYRLEALAPGLNPDSLAVTANRDSLTISGEKPAPAGVKAEQYHRSERSAGKFTRTVSLDATVDVNRISAEYRNGLLTVKVPKAEEAKPKSISVAVSN
jgi:HSP20 family protein